MFELMYLIALPSLFLLVLCGLYGLTTWFSMQKEKALTMSELFLYIENPWLDQGFDKALAMSL